MDDDATFSIKQVADLFGNTRGAIRFYQEKGLIDPTVADNGLRSYSTDDVLQLLYLKNFASMSFTLDETARWFRAEAEASLPEIITLMDDRAIEIEQRVEQLKRQLSAIEDYRSMLQDALDGTVRIVEVPAYWSLDWRQMPDMIHDEPEVLNLLISLISEVVIGGAYDLNNLDMPSTVEVRIQVEVARREGLPRSRFFREMPATRLATCTTRCMGDDWAPQLLDAIRGLADHALAQGYCPSGSAFTRIILNHCEDGAHTEYHRIFLPIESD